MPGSFDLFCEFEPTEVVVDLPSTTDTAYELELKNIQRRREKTMSKLHRMSLYQSTLQSNECPIKSRKALFMSRKSDLRSSPELIRARSLSLMDRNDLFSIAQDIFEDDESPMSAVVHDEKIMARILLFVPDAERVQTMSLVCTKWSESVTTSQTMEVSDKLGALMLSDREFQGEGYEDDESSADGDNDNRLCQTLSTQHNLHMDDRTWDYLNSQFPWACFLSEGAFKQVYKVYNSTVGEEEVISIMDTESIFDKKIIVSEYIVSLLLSSLTRRGICPNFVTVHGSFTCASAPLEAYWGNFKCHQPNGSCFEQSKFNSSGHRPDRSHPGRYHCLRTELCEEGDAEEYIKKTPKKTIDPDLSRILLFQVAFALHAAANKFSMKHYDIKLLNIFLKRISSPCDRVVLRYAIGCRTFALEMNSQEAFFAKVADYGTANTKAESNGQPVTIAQFTTQENTPPDFLILGDAAKQGHGHDNFGLGLCMLHLFTGSAPYEEIMKKVVCPPNLKKKLKLVWENDKVDGFKVIQTCILSDVYKDEAGHIVEGDPDETLYNTFYRFLVLFDTPEEFQQVDHPLIWKVVDEALKGRFVSKNGRVTERKQGTDIAQYERDQQKFSIRCGSNKHISRARHALQQMHGGLDLLFHLCHFDPSRRATALDVMNSEFMAPLCESADAMYGNDTTVYSYLAFSTQK
jgi:serine/threonine protein kinase